MDARLQLVAIVGAVGLLLVVLDMVRRRALMERYALLWLLSSVVILALAVWENALTTLARQIGIVSAPNALFFVAVGFILLLLLHFSAAVSRLTDQSKVLAQHQAMLEQQVRDLQRASAQAADEDDAALEPLLRSGARHER